MPQPLRIALLVFVALGIVGLIICTFVRALKKSEDPVKLIVKWLVTLIVGGGFLWFAKGGVNSPGGAFMVGLGAMIVGVVLSLVWAPNIGHLLFSPILSALDGGNEEPDPVPLYSTAQALRQRGRYREALYAVQEQLQKFPHDFAGQMMVAEIHAENLNDLAAAENDIHRLCAQPKQSPANLAFALNTLADWHLKYAQDIEAARGDELVGAAEVRDAVRRHARRPHGEDEARRRIPRPVEIPGASAAADEGPAAGGARTGRASGTAPAGSGSARAAGGAVRPHLRTAGLGGGTNRTAGGAARRIAEARRAVAEPAGGFADRNHRTHG
jgi:hypothetical protein